LCTTAPASQCRNSSSDCRTPKTTISMAHAPFSFPLARNNILYPRHSSYLLITSPSKLSSPSYSAQASFHPKCDMRGRSKEGLISLPLINVREGKEYVANVRPDVETCFAAMHQGSFCSSQGCVRAACRVILILIWPCTTISERENCRKRKRLDGRSFVLGGIDRSR
jgi:hypothetical protein